MFEYCSHKQMNHKFAYLTQSMSSLCIPLYSFDALKSVQSYNEGGWDYTTELRKFVDGGMTGTGFIDGVSGIVNRGCHNPVSRLAPPCTNHRLTYNARLFSNIVFHNINNEP